MLNKILFISNKWSRKISCGLCVLIVVACIFTIINYNQDCAKLLQSLSELSMTIILAVIGLGISVFQSDFIQLNKKEFKQKYIDYIFSMFIPILTVILGFFVSILFKRVDKVIKFYIIITVLILLNSITNTLKYFVSIFNIKD